MPEGRWSLSTLPGKALFVGMGLEGSLRFLPCLPLNWSFAELVWIWASTMMYPGVNEGQSFSSPSAPLQLGLPFCINVWHFKAPLFRSTLLTWRFLRTWHQLKAESFNLTALCYTTDPIDGRVLHSLCSFLNTTMFHCLFSPWELHSKSSQRVRLFGLRLSLSSLFTISVQKRHSPLSWTFTHTYTQNMLTNANS